MIRSIYTAATGMEAQQLYMDTISNNLSNVNTNSFKRERVEFQDLLYQTLKEPGTRNSEGEMAPSGIEVGLGVKPGATQRIFEQGPLTQTTNDYDLAISGTGFYQISMPDGGIAYTRDGSFKSSSDGTVVTSDGYPVYPQITVPEGASDFQVNSSGVVQVTLQGEKQSSQIGQIELTRFINPSGLKALGSNLYTETESSGEPVVETPNQNGMGTIQQHYSEASNVQIVEEMVNMISAQRAYEIVSKAIQTSEEMMTIANNLKR
jgi:flagellar basal-body rod protein FlgG